MTHLNRTALNTAHRALGARMVDFGGWDMPLHYGSQLEEHHRVRRDAGMFDVSHMLALDVTGAQAEVFLQGLLANDVGRLGDGKALYSCMLNAEGGVIDDLIVYRLAPARYRAVVNAAAADGDLAWMNRERMARAGEIAIAPRRDLAMIAVQGPHAREKTSVALPEIGRAGASLKPFAAAECGDALVAVTGYTGEDGYEIALPAARAEQTWRALLDAGVAPAGLGARDTLRLEAGMNLYGQDMDAHTTPFEAGLAWTVKLDAGRDFVGKAALAARIPRFRLLGLALLDKGVMRTHQRVLTAAGDGRISSGGFAPTLGRSIALARLPLAARPGDEVQVEVRDRQLAARVVEPPFVRRGQALVIV